MVSNIIINRKDNKFIIKDTGKALELTQRKKRGERVKALREDAGETQTRLGDVLGVTFQQIQRIERGEAELKPKYLSGVALHYKKPLNYFFEGLGLPALTTSSSAEPNIVRVDAHVAIRATLEATATVTRPIPVISWVMAGSMTEICDPFPVGNGDGTVFSSSKDDNAFALRVVGDSMTPRFLENDIVIVSPNTAYYSGAKVIAQVLNDRGALEATFKYLKIEGDPPDQLFILRASNPKYDSRYFERPPGEAEDSWRIVGVICDHIPCGGSKNGY